MVISLHRKMLGVAIAAASMPMSAEAAQVHDPSVTEQIANASSLEWDGLREEDIAAMAGGAPICDPDLFYGSGYVDVCHYGRGPDARPMVVLVHGSKSTKLQMRQDWGWNLFNAGYVVASIQYDLKHCPENLLTATSWLRRNAANFGGDPDRIGIVGASWGGTCSSIVALTMPVPGVRALALASATIPVPASNLLEGNPIEVLIMQTTNNRVFSVRRSQETYRILRNAGVFVRRITYDTNTNRLLSIGSHPLDSLNDFLGDVLGKPKP